MESVAVVIINYKSSNLIKGLVESIVEPDLDLSIVILDNSSTQETFQELQDIKDSRIQILRSEDNLGFTGGINTVLDYINQVPGKYSYFFLLNPDAFSSPGLIHNLLLKLKNEKDAAAISPRISHLNGTPWYAGGYISYSKGVVVSHIEATSKSPDNYYEVDVFSGCAVLFDFNKVLQVGKFNQGLFMYYDEADLSIRLLKKGYKILYEPSYTILHDVSYTTRKISHLKTYYMTRNKFKVFNSTMSAPTKIYFLLYELAFHLKNRRIKNAVFHLKGYYHYLSGKSGAYA